MNYLKFYKLSILSRLIIKKFKRTFILIFPELKNLDRLKRLDKISKTSELSKEILLSVILIDNKDNHEYFSHKYKISNDLKDQLNLIAKIS